MKSNKRCKKKLFYIIGTLLTVFGVWKGIRTWYVFPCTYETQFSVPDYAEQEQLMKAIALSYLVYGCETSTGLSGTVQEILAQHEMGILIENAGIIRTVKEDRTSAVIDSAAFIKEHAGRLRFLMFVQDAQSGFYGAAFCDDENKCIWITYSGSVTVQDAMSCVAYAVTPWLSKQEKLAFELFDNVLDTKEVKELSYTVLLTGHSLGGALAAAVSCASNCKAVTINGATGLAIGKMYDILKEEPSEYKIINYLTSPKNGKVSFMDGVQRLMFLGPYKKAECYIYEENGLTEDSHSVFSFVTDVSLAE